MTKEVAGVPLADFHDPIVEAIRRYGHLSYGNIKIYDPEGAADLVLTPDKPYSAASEAEVRFIGGIAAKLNIFALAPGEAIGDMSRDSGIIPTPRPGIHTEAHLTISTHRIDTPDHSINLFGGRLDLLGIGQTPGSVTKLAEVGKRPIDYPVAPLATAITGYYDSRRMLGQSGERFGDPHLLLNSTMDMVQVFATLAMSQDMVSANPKVLQLLTMTTPLAPS